MLIETIPGKGHWKMRGIRQGNIAGAKGFSIIELLVTFVVLGILVGLAIPAFSVWLPNYQLTSAAKELYANLNLTKLGAIKQNKSWAVVFDPNSDRYFICNDDGANNSWDGPPSIGGDDTVVKTVELDHYGKGITFSHGAATAAVGGGSFPGDNVSYASNAVAFNPTGFANSGYVYLGNTKGKSYAVGTLACGVIMLKRWDSGTWTEQ